MPKLTRKSKRMSLKLQSNITRRSKNVVAKAKKLAKKHPELAKKKNKDPGIPNLWPFKEDLMKSIEKQRQVEEDEKVRHREARNKLLAKKRNQDLAKSLAHAAANSGRDISRPEITEFEGKAIKTREQEAAGNRQYFRELKKVIEQSEIILEVLDARDPMGCRALDVERRIISQISGERPKRIILVLNKIDMIPPDVAMQWVKFLRREYPCVAFKSSTQETKRLGQAKMKASNASQEQLASGSAVGANELLQLLKNYSRSHNIKTAITVGIIGYPNVGKSSIINSLKRSRAVAVGATPGLTKQTQEVKLDKQVVLIDSPGVMFSAGSEDESLLLRNVLKVQEIEDPVSVVHGMLKKCPKQTLMQLYKIPDFVDPDDFIRHVAQRKGILAAGAVANMDLCARQIINDWNSGKIPFYSLPPVVHNQLLSSEVVSEWSREFDVDSVFSEEEIRKSVGADEEGSRPAFYTQLSSSGPRDVGVDDDDDDEGENPFVMGDEDDEEKEEKEEEVETKISSHESHTGFAMKLPKSKESAKDAPSPASLTLSGRMVAQDAHNPQVNREMRMKQKNSLKKKKRERRKSIAAASSSMGDDGEGEGEDYDFAKDFQ